MNQCGSIAEFTNVIFATSGSGMSAMANMRRSKQNEINTRSINDDDEMRAYKVGYQQGITQTIARLNSEIIKSL